MRNQRHSDKLHSPVSWPFLLAAPLFTALFLLTSYAFAGFYPFGEGTISWCDMDQQVVPLLLNFKDIFSGHGTALYSFQNAGGMNFWGVFFFFIASPFSFLTLFVEKENMLLFMNILVMLKLCLCAFTAAFYFARCHRRIKPEFAMLFGLFYAFSGYSMLFYQNIIWLDMMYLFPLLLLSFERLLYRKKTLPYVLTLSAMMVINYYISYMIVLFTLLYFGIVSLIFTGSRRKEAAVRFLGGSFIAALLTAAIWLPCFLQYLSSGRDISILTSLSESEFFTSLETTLSILFPSACALTIMIYGLLHMPLRHNLLRSYFLLFLLLFIPLLIEPINRMWHTGNYQGFPIRYGFITIFMALAVAADLLSSSDPNQRLPLTSRVYYLAPAGIFLLILGYGFFSHYYVEAHLETLRNYTRTLWGDMDSLKGLFTLFLLSAFLYFLIYRGLCKRHLTSRVFTLLCLLLFLVDIHANTAVYMFSADYEGHNDGYEYAMDLSHFQPEKESSGEFYRVKSHQKYFDVNLIGGMGFPSLSHYTSLTSQDYMFAMKKLGYSSYWMEVSGNGGTLLSDAALSAAYEIQWNSFRPSLYQNDVYQISDTPFYLSLGLPTTQSFDDTNDLESLTRLQVQELLFAKLFPGLPSPLCSYEPNHSNGCQVYMDNFHYYQLELDQAKVTGHIYYQIHIDDPQTLYFDCFDRLSNQLSEHINESFDVYVNGTPVDLSYPSKNSNGLIQLGTFQDETIIVDIALLHSVTCRSFGVFGIDHSLLSSAISTMEPLNLQAEGRTITGKAETQIDQNVFLSIPYDEGWTLKIDGKKADLSQAFLGYSSFFLPAGSHSIQMVYSPPGLHFGLILSLLGAVLGLACLALYRRQSAAFLYLLDAAWIQKLSYLITVLLMLLVIGAIYIMPLLLSLIGKIT